MHLGGCKQNNQTPKIPNELYLEVVNRVLDETILKIQYVKKLLAIKGVGIITIAGFRREVGDIRRFDSPKQIKKYAGLELVENSSGKHKRRT